MHPYYTKMVFKLPTTFNTPARGSTCVSATVTIVVVLSVHTIQYVLQRPSPDLLYLCESVAESLSPVVVWSPALVSVRAHYHLLPCTNKMFMDIHFSYVFLHSLVLLFIHSVSCNYSFIQSFSH